MMITISFPGIALKRQLSGKICRVKQLVVSLFLSVAYNLGCCLRGDVCSPIPWYRIIQVSGKIWHLKKLLVLLFLCLPYNLGCCLRSDVCSPIPWRRIIQLFGKIWRMKKLLVSMFLCSPYNLDYCLLRSDVCIPFRPGMALIEAATLCVHHITLVVV